jgi:hypothetical protein
MNAFLKCKILALHLNYLLRHLIHLFLIPLNLLFHLFTFIFIHLHHHHYFFILLRGDPSNNLLKIFALN